MVNPKQHDWDTFQMLPFSVLNFYCLQTEIFLLKNGCKICFLMKTLTFHQPFSIHNLMLSRCWLKNVAFFYRCLTLHIPKINSFLDFKRNKSLWDNKNWEALDAAVSYMGQWLWAFSFLYNRGTHFLKNQKQQNRRLYSQK